MCIRDRHYTEWLDKHYPDSYKKFVKHNLIDKMPIMLPDDVSPIINPVPDPSTQKFFDSSLNIVTETYGMEFEGSIFLTDKVWKPILHFQPFVIVGTKGHLKALHERGYKTFSNWIDEDYDNISNDQKRLTAVMNSAKKFYNRSEDQISQDLADMIDVLIHLSLIHI